MKNSDSKRKEGKNHANSLVSADTGRPSDPPTIRNSKRTSSKKRMLEENLRADAPAKQAKTDGSKKVGRLGKPDKTNGRNPVHKQESTTSNLSETSHDNRSSLLRVQKTPSASKWTQLRTQH